MFAPYCMAAHKSMSPDRAAGQHQYHALNAKALFKETPLSFLEYTCNAT